jgi:hypothetical protein
MDDLKKQFESSVQQYIDECVKAQDFHVIETPLKTDAQYKAEMKHRLKDELTYANLIGSHELAIETIRQYLSTVDDKEQKERVEIEIANSMDHFKEFRDLFLKQELPIEEWIEKNNPEAKTWSLFYGISDDTINFLYDIVLKKISESELAEAKGLLQLMLLYAPGISSYWNALGFCLQKEGHYEEALVNYQMAKEMNATNLETYFYLARCYHAMNNFILAEEQVEQLKQLISESDELRKEWELHVKNLEKTINNSSYVR